MKKKAPEQASKRMVESLLKEIQNEYGRYNRNYGARYDALLKKSEELRVKLLNSKTLKKIEAEITAIEKKYEQTRSDAISRVAKIRRRYLANGVIPKVVKDLNELVDDLEKNT